MKSYELDDVLAHKDDNSMIGLIESEFLNIEDNK